MIPVVAFIGPSKSGKTTLIEKVVSRLSSRGLAVGTVKHIRDGDFSIDVKGKDTWRHAEAGARVVVAATDKQVAVLKKQASPYETLEEILDLLGNEKLDAILIEGFRSLTSKRHDVLKVLLVKTPEDVEGALKDVVEPIIAIVGPPNLRNIFPSEKPSLFFDFDTEKEKAVDLVTSSVANVKKQEKASGNA